MLPSKFKNLITLPEILIGIHNEISFSKFTTKKNYRASVIWDKNQEEEEGKYFIYKQKNFFLGQTKLEIN